MEYVEPNIVKLSNSDFELEESWQNIRGFDVYDIKGEQIGTVEDFYVDREAHVSIVARRHAGVGCSRAVACPRGAPRCRCGSRRRVVRVGRHEPPDGEVDCVSLWRTAPGATNRCRGGHARGVRRAHRV